VNIDGSLYLPFTSNVCFPFHQGENYGEKTASIDTKSLTEGVQVLRTNKAVLYCGLVQSLFEGAMYSFVFEWTPALTPAGEGVEVPYGTYVSDWL
jgi:hypothetical protein